MDKYEAQMLLSDIEAWVTAVIDRRIDPNGEDWGNAEGKARERLAQKIEAITN